MYPKQSFLVTTTEYVCSGVSSVPHSTTELDSTTTPDLSTVVVTVWTSTTTTVDFRRALATDCPSTDSACLASVSTIGCSANVVTTWATVTATTVRVAASIGQSLSSPCPVYHPKRTQRGRRRKDRRQQRFLVDNRLIDLQMVPTTIPTTTTIVSVCLETANSFS